MSRATRLTATGNAPGGVMRGFYVSNTNAGTMVIRHGNSAGDQISGTITPAVGWHTFPAIIDAANGAGVHITIGGTALDVTVVMD